MSTQNARKKSKMGRPPVDSDELRARVERPVIDALDAYARGSALTRPQAIRAVLSDWLTGHGFLNHSSREPEKIADKITALDAEHAAMDAKPSPKKALNRMKAAIARNDHKAARPKK